MPTIIERMAVDAILLGQRKRALDESKLPALEESMRSLGLRTPISVRMVPDAVSADGAVLSDQPALVAGLHRLEAAKRLGWEMIDVAVIDGDEIDARLWEIAENLHRAELSPVDRAEHIDEWRRLTADKGRQVDTPLGGHQPHDKGFKKTAETLGVSEPSIRRAEKIASLPQDVRDQARAEGWTQDRLLKAATPDRAKLAQIAAERSGKTENKQIDRDIGEQAAAEFAEWLITHGALPVIPQIVTWLEATKTRDVIRELHRQSAGVSIMDAA